MRRRRHFDAAETIGLAAAMRGWRLAREKPSGRRYDAAASAFGFSAAASLAGDLARPRLSDGHSIERRRDSASTPRRALDAAARAAAARDIDGATGSYQLARAIFTT